MVATVAIRVCGVNHAGLPAHTPGYSVGEQLCRLLNIVSTRTAEEMRDRVEFLSAW